MTRRISVFLFLLLAVALLPAGAMARTSVTAARVAAHPDGITRFVIDISDSMVFRVRLLADPYRVVIDTDGMEMQAELRKAAGAISGMHYAEDAGGGHLVLQLQEPAEVKSAFVIAPRDNLGWRFVMDLRETSRQAFLMATGQGAVVRRNSPLPVVPLKNAEARPPKPIVIPKPVVIMAAASAMPGDLPPPEVTVKPETSVKKDVPVKQDALGNPPAKSIVVLSPLADKPAPVAPPTPLIVVEQPSANPLLSTQPVSQKSSPVVVQEVQAVMPAPEPEPAPVVDVLPPTPQPRPKSGSVPMLSAPMPPPPERPAVIPVAVPVPQPVSAPPEPLPVAKASLPIPAPDFDIKPPRADGRPVIVIDPGHGGVDPGATSVTGVYEKVITLAVARDLKEQLERTGRYHVYLTRDRDVFIRLRDRVAIARQYNADLFISLHADVVNDPDIRGLSVYTLSQNASSAEAQALADKENKADLIVGIDLSHETADVANILIDLAQRETMNRSAAFATGIVGELGHETELLENSHRFAGFAVLKAPDVPAVLIEAGYLSNDVEERNLRQPEYRGKLSRAITRAVDHFFLQSQKAKR